jgi:bifunctional enzyme CysN/CysC
MPVQWVNRPNLDFRGFAGLIASGSVKPGDEIRVVPSGKTSRVARIVTLDGDLEEAVAGQSVTLTFEDEIDCSRGDVIAASNTPPEVADQFEASLVWMADDALIRAAPIGSSWARRWCPPPSTRRNTPSTSTRWSIAPPRRWG